jgi:hypothetical protein
MPPHTHGSAGQGTVEYVAILAVVALVLTAAIAASAAFAPGVANAVMGHVRHALCVVTGRACAPVAAALRPCVVRTAREGRSETVSVGVVQLGAGRVVLRERLSDGTLRLTVLHRGRAGLSAGWGASSRVRVGGVGLDVGAHAQATVAGLVGAGQVFHVRTAAEADRILDRLRATGSPTVDAVRRIIGGGDGPAADARLLEGGLGARLDLELSGGEVSAGVGGGGENVLGRRIDRQTGATTWYLRLGRSVPAFADALLGGASGELDGDALLEVTQDRAGRPTEVAALVGGLAEGAASMQAGPSGTVGGSRWEAEARVSLEDPDVLAALRRWRSSPLSDDAVVGLGRALRDRANVDVRRYTREASSDADGASAGAGVRLAVELGRDAESTRLVSAVTRPPGGLWERRLDCVG